MEFTTTIGLEVHTQLATASKAWCSCEVKVNAFENDMVCEICSAQPGTLPVMNTKSVDLAIMLALALNCKINKTSLFDRKNYFYPDLPKGFQITQFDCPVAENGYVEIFDSKGNIKKIRIERIQLEEDTGKSTHYENHSLINLNRAGTPLIEVVTRPDFENEEQSVQFLKKLQAILVYLGVSEGNMQDGNLRCDVNLSLAQVGSEELGTRTEVKNLNSFRSVEKAIDHERKRQANVLDKGKKVLQQTLIFDVDTGKTRVLRTKSDADDYRYHREPDLLPLIIDEKRISKIKDELPELPAQKASRFVSSFNIPTYDAEVICSDKNLADYFEESCKAYSGSKFKLVANWVMGDFLRFINEARITPQKSKVTPDKLAGLISLIETGDISGKIGKDVFLEMFDSGADAKSIVKSKGLKQNSNEGELEELVQKLIAQNPKEAQELKEGRDRLMGFFVGQVMKNTGGKANPGLTTALVKKHLGI